VPVNVGFDGPSGQLGDGPKIGFPIEGTLSRKPRVGNRTPRYLGGGGPPAGSRSAQRQLELP
jgi:hypothetical protein